MTKVTSDFQGLATKLNLTTKLSTLGKQLLSYNSTLEPTMNQHRLVIDKSLIRQDFEGTNETKYKLFYQMTRLIRDKGSLAHDDRLEALAMAVSYWTDQMAKDVDASEQEHRETLLETELERFKEFALGIKAKPFTWMKE